MWICKLLTALGLVTLVLGFTSTGGDGGEYCEDEMFRASCAENEAVVIETASYGRMREGRCVSGNYGHIGCANDVRAHLDRWCSGRPSCEVPVTNLLRGVSKICPKDFRSFLEATYSCVNVMSVKKDECRSASFVEVTAAEGFISSLITEDSGCGSIDTPWLIKAKPGQNINITLWDFDTINHKNSGLAASHSGLPPPCHVYAIIKERTVTSSKTVCPKDQRRSHVFLSSGDTVEIRIVTKKQEKDDHGYFLLKFQAIGCPDIEPPRGGWVKRVGDNAVVGCKATDESWRLKCHHNTWVGNFANCSSMPVTAGVSGRIWNVMSSSQGISIAIIIGVAILVGIFILIAGLVCLKWQRQKRQDNANTFSQVACYNAEDARGYTASEVEKHRNSLDPYNASENNYYRTWQLQQRAKQSIQGTELPPPPYHPVSSSSDVRDSRYVEHVYESPKFDRRDVSGSESGDFTHAQYFELDPDAVDIPHTLGRNRNHLRQQNLAQDREISWLPRSEMEISEVGPGPLPR